MTLTKQILMARSTAGHDRGKYYVVVREEPEYLYLSDGESRTVESPKKKNRKHVQIIKKIPANILAVFASGHPLTDPEIKKALKLYRQNDEQQEEEQCQKQM